ncbi:MAG: hypothetical protein ACI9KE_001861 [Polyangiales bacterium]|jgi:hypothetical protein
MVKQGNVLESVVGSVAAFVTSRCRIQPVFLVAVCTLVACGEGFEIADADAATSDAPTIDGSPEDIATSDAAFEDGSSQDVQTRDTATPRDRCEPPNPCSGECEMPWLLATAQDLGGEGRCGGRVFRYSLSEAGACACPGYQTVDDNLPTTASYIPGGTVIVGTASSAFTFGGSRMERYLDGNGAVDTFIVEGRSPGSDPVGILTAGRIGGGAAKSLFVFGADGSYEALGFDSAMTLSSDTSTQNPANPRGYRSADLGRPSVNRLFWEGGVEDLMHFDSGASGGLEAFYANGFHRTVISFPEGVRHIANETLTINNAPATQSCRGSEYEGCSYLGAAPDPLSEHHVYVACQQPIEERQASRIARLDVRDDSCVDVLPLEHWRRIRITHLTIGLENYWAP